jgi:curved DNA-binding protein CbpA
MYNYFKNCQSLDEARSLYRKLALENHPDHGGDLRVMQEINRQWAEYQVIGAKMDARQRQEKAHSEGKKSAADYHDIDELGEILRIKVEALLNISPELIVEVCGLWVWVTGETKKHYTSIKAIEGMRYASDKGAWYFAAIPSFNRTRRTMEEIRQMHGSQRFSRGNQEEETNRQSLHA